jgi:hypothetical protein
MDQATNSQTPTHPESPKPKGRFTGERLKVLRPDVYRRVVDLLAEPREHVPYDHICRLLHVSEHTVKAIERSQSIPIAERKQRLLTKALRIADKAADRIEDQIDGANITQATIAFGVSTEKALLLAGEPACRMEVNLRSVDVYSEFLRITAEIRAAVQQLPPPASETPLLEAEIVPG